MGRTVQHTYIHKCTYTCTHKHMHTYIYRFTLTQHYSIHTQHMHKHSCTSIQTQIRTQIHTKIHTHTATELTLHSKLLLGFKTVTHAAPNVNCNCFRQKHVLVCLTNHNNDTHSDNVRACTQTHVKTEITHPAYQTSRNLPGTYDTIFCRAPRSKTFSKERVSLSSSA